MSEEDPAGQDESQPPAEQPPAGLGDAGKKAIDAMKAERNTAREEARKAQETLDRLKAEQEGKQREYEQQQHDRKVEQDALSKANERILKAEIRAAAAAKMADPEDALRFLNLSEFEVDSDGEVDSTKIGAALDGLMQKKPYLAAQGDKKVWGSADGGARNEHGNGKPQITKDQLSSMSPQEIVAAKEAGQLDHLLGRK